MDSSQLASAAKRKRFPIWIYIVVLLLIAILALAPLGSVIVAGWIAESHGCRLDEGGIYPCMIGGSDWGETLATMFVLGWLMLITLPIGAVLFLVWSVVLIAHALRWRRKQRAALATPLST